MSTSSVFPLEIYEHVMELAAEGDKFTFLLGDNFSYVCTAWRPKSRALVYRRINIQGLQGLGLATMRKLKKQLISFPHFAPLVEDVELYLHVASSNYQSIVEAFPAMLGRYLPRLRRLIVNSDRDYLRIHPHFSIGRVEIHTLTVLEIFQATFDDKYTLQWFIAPFPSLHVLDLYNTIWTKTPTIEKLPALIELDIGFRGNIASTKATRDTYERLLNAASGTVRSLSVTLHFIYILTSLYDYKSPDIYLGAVEVLSMEVHADHWLTNEENMKGIPYSRGISDMVSFLLRLDAKKIRVLNISFKVNTFSFSDSEEDFFDSLRPSRQMLEELVLRNHFPSLQAIHIDVGASALAVPIWQDRFESFFPSLAQQQLLHVKEYIPKQLPMYKPETCSGLSLSSTKQDNKGKCRMP